MQFLVPTLFAFFGLGVAQHGPDPAALTLLSKDSLEASIRVQIGNLSGFGIINGKADLKILTTITEVLDEIPTSCHGSPTPSPDDIDVSSVSSIPSQFSVGGD